jgi:8-oxo-dGTP diphosphatase
VNAVHAVGAIVFDDEGAVLLVRRGRPPQRGRWTLPGGRVEPNETAHHAIVREVREETGLVVTHAQFVERFTLRGEGYVYEIDEHVCEVVAGIPTAGDDADDVRFVKGHEFDALGVTAEVVGVIARARKLRRLESL